MAENRLRPGRARASRARGGGAGRWADTIVLLLAMGGLVALALGRLRPTSAASPLPSAGAATPAPRRAVAPPSRAHRLRVRRAVAVGVLVVAGALAVAGLARSSGATIATFAGDGGTPSDGDNGQATAASIDHPSAVVVTAAGVAYIAESSGDRVRRVAADGTITTVAGTGASGYSGDGGQATSARLNSPYGLAVDGAGNLFIADTLNHVVRKVDTAGVISTVAGTGTSGFGLNGGSATTTELNSPAAVAVEADGDLLIADYGSHRVRKVDGAGIISTVAGTGLGAYSGDGGSATRAALDSPADVAVTADGGFLIADSGNLRIRRVSSGGTITTVAGDGTSGSTGDGGPATAARFRLPAGVLEAGGEIFISDRHDHRVRRVATDGTIATVAGTGASGYSGDGGDASLAKLHTPHGIAAGPGGVYIADAANHRVRRVAGLIGPAEPTVSAADPAGPANDNAPSISGSAATGSTVRLYTNASCTSAVAASGSAADFASPGLAVSVSDDTTTSFYATATDADGNRSACSASSVSYTEDSTPPGAASITDAPATPASDTTPTWSFSGPATLECRLDGPGGEVEAWAACSSPETTAELTADGAYTFSVRTRDAAGNTSTAVTSSYTLDRSAPLMTDAPADLGNDSTPTWTFSATGASSYECRTARDGESTPAWAPCTTPHTTDLGAAPDGSYTFAVRALDSLGNPSSSITDAFELDTTAPAAPVLTAQPPGIGSDPSPSWSWTADAGARVECRLERDGAATEAWAPCSSPRRAALSGEPDGTYRLGVRAIDAAGNVAAAMSGDYVLDRAAPAAPAYVAGPPPSGNAAGVAWSFAGDAGSAYECRLEHEGAAVVAFAPCASPRGYDLADRPDGSYVIAVSARDGAGNTTVSRSAPYVLDRVGPPAVGVTARPGAVGNDVTPTWTLSAGSAAAIECGLFRGGDAVAALGVCTTSRTFDLSDQEDGAYALRAHGLDAVGNAGALVEDAYVLDTVAPPAPEIRGHGDAEGAGESPVWRFAGEAGAILECRLSRGGEVLSRMTVCASPRSYDLSEVEDGTYTFTVRATDAAGNVGRSSTAEYRLTRPQPAAAAPTATAPTAGPPPAPPAPPTPPAAARSTDAPLPAAAERERAAAERRAAERRAERQRPAAAVARRAGAPDGSVSPSAPAPETEKRQKKGLAAAAEKLAAVGKVVAKAAGVVAEKSAFPGLLLAFCGVFLVVQDRIDRRDPKLALAPIDADPELEFLPLDALRADDPDGAPPCPA